MAERAGLAAGNPSSIRAGREVEREMTEVYSGTEGIWVGEGHTLLEGTVTDLIDRLTSPVCKVRRERVKLEEGPLSHGVVHNND